MISFEIDPAKSESNRTMHGTILWQRRVSGMTLCCWKSRQELMIPDGHPNSPTPATAQLQPTVSACEPYRAFVEAQLRLNRNFMAIY
jgi:hypothetical protein